MGKESERSRTRKDKGDLMELIAIIVLAALLPIMSITAFIVGYNVNADKKIFKPKPKSKPRELTEDEIMLDRIDKARI